MAETVISSFSDRSPNPNKAPIFLTDPLDPTAQRKHPLSKPRLAKSRKSTVAKPRPHVGPTTSERIEDRLSGWNPFVPDQVRVSSSPEGGVFVFGTGLDESSEKLETSKFVFGSEMIDSLEKMESLTIKETPLGRKDTDESNARNGISDTLHDDLEKLKIGKESEVPFTFKFNSSGTNSKEQVDTVKSFTFGAGENLTGSVGDTFMGRNDTGQPSVSVFKEHEGRKDGTSVANSLQDDLEKLKIGNDTVKSFAFGIGENVTGSFGGSVVNTVHEDMAKLKIGSTPVKFGFGAGEMSQASSTSSVPVFQAKAPNVEFSTPPITNSLFRSKSENIVFRGKSGKGKSTKSKKKVLKEPALWHQNVYNHFVPAEGSFQENYETEPTDAYSPMDCSPYPEETVVDNETREADTQRSISVEREEVLVSAAEKLDINKGSDINQAEAEDNAPGLSTATSFDAEPVFVFGKESDMPKYKNVEFGSDTRTASAEMEVETGPFGSTIGERASSVESGFVFSSGVEGSSQPAFSFTSLTYSQGPLLQEVLSRKKVIKSKPGRSSHISTMNDSVIFPTPSPNIFPPTISSMPPVSSLEQKCTSFVLQKDVGKAESQDSNTNTNTALIAAMEEACEKWRHRGNQAYASGNSTRAEDCYTRGIDSITIKEIANSCIRPLTLCYSNRAATRMSLGRMREAIADCKMALTVDPSFLRAQLRAANCYLSLGEIGEALNAFNKCLQVKDANSNQKILTDATEGLQKAQKVADLTGQCAELLSRKTLNDASTALHIISEALLISPLSESLTEMKAEALLTMRKYEEVIQCCEGSLDLAEKNSSGNVVDAELFKGSLARLWRWNLISKSYFHLGKFEEALDLLQKHETVKSAVDKYGKISSDSSTSLAVTINELLRLKAAGNEAFQAAKHSEAVECYTAALVMNSDSRPFSAVCFCNRAAAYQALGQIADAIADCSLAIALDASYPKAISRRATLHEMIRDYGQAVNDLQRLISLLEKCSEEKDNKNDLKQARKRLAIMEEEERKGRSLDMYMILGVEPSCSAADIKKAYRKAALRHHPDKAGQFLVRNENNNDGLRRELANALHSDADRLFKMIGESYTILSDPTKRLQYDAEEEARTNPKKEYSRSSTSKTPTDTYNNQYERGFNRRQWRSQGGSSQRW